MAFLSGYTSRWEYKVLATKVASTQTSFPVYVDLGDMPASFWSTVANGGGDIRVTQSDGTTECAREVVSCDTATDTGELHFLANSIDGTTDTIFYIYANGTSTDYAVTATYGRNAVWSDYANVYHMKDATTSTISDSTSNGDTLTKDSANNPIESTGKIGSAQDFNGSTDFASASYASGGNANETVTFWLNTTKTSLSNPLWVDDGGGALKGTYLNNTTNDGKFIVLYQKEGGTSERLRGDTNADVGIDDGNWHKVTYTVNNATSDIQIYIDGSPVARTMLNTNDISGISVTELYVGAREIDLTGYVDGGMDEIRFRSGVQSANWITTEYNNQNDHSTWATIGAEETDGGAVRNALFLGGGM